MFSNTFSHKTIKNTIICFGALFSNIKINRSNGTDNQTVAVPIVYGGKEKIIKRLQENPNLDNQVLVTLPRMAFKIESMSYDPTRMTNRNNKLFYKNPNNSVSATFTPVPYNLNINLYLLTKGTEDALDVIEQITPSFAPDFTATISTIPEMQVTQDIPFVLNSVTQEDDYEGDFSVRQLTTTVFSFTVKLNLYGAVGPSSIITRTQTSVLTANSSIMGVHTSTGNPITGQITSDFWT